MSHLFFPLVTLPSLQVGGNTHNCLTLTHYHFTSWPDNSVPEYGTPLLTLHKIVMANYREDGGPILVHCSAGVGRTGTFITIDLALEQAKTEGVVDFIGIINRLREQRMQMVQTVVCKFVYWSTSPIQLVLYHLPSA